MENPEAERARIARIARERAAGTYPEYGRAALARIVEVHAAGQSLKRVRNPHLRVCPPEELARVGRNEPCPCGSGNKSKWCCRQLIGV